MLEIVLLIVGLVYAVKRPKLSRLTVGDYPDVDPARFLKWRRMQLKATDVFLWATWGAFVLKIFIVLALSDARGPGTDVVYGIIIIGWLAALTMAAVIGSKARQLRLAAGIQWPKKA